MDVSSLSLSSGRDVSILSCQTEEDDSVGKARSGMREVTNASSERMKQLETNVYFIDFAFGIVTQSDSSQDLYSSTYSTGMISLF